MRSTVLSARPVFATQEEKVPLGKYIKGSHAATIQHVPVRADKRYLATSRIRRSNYAKKTNYIFVNKKSVTV
jgi:hypothetical protein